MSEVNAAYMKLRRFLSLISASVILTVACSACGNAEKASVTNEFNADTPAEAIPTQTVASNALYKLDWNNENKCLLLTELSTGKIWSNIPYEYLQSGGTSANVNSTLNITVADAVSLQLTSLRGATESVQNGRVFCEKIENGVRITYCFDRYSISVPVEYTLRADSLSVTIDTPEICEGSSHLLVAVSLAPFLCSAKNSDGNSYLLVPTGSGALMYAEETSELERKYQGEVYGTDVTRPITESIANEQAVRLPVFGAKDGDSAIMGIIESNAGSALLEATAGNSRTGYSNIYPTFYVRGYDVFDKSSYASERMTDDLTRISELITKEPISVGYYILSGADADYNGMARCYRKYLQANGLSEAKKSSDSPYSVTVSGGVLTTSLIFGIPAKTLKTMTTFSEAQDIIADLIESTGISPVVRLQGFGESGINYGKIGGGFKLSSKLGSQKARKALESLCNENAVQLFYDFDLIHYSKSGGGFSYISDAAKTAIYKAAEQYPVNTPLREFDETMPYRILSRSNLLKATEKLIKMAESEKLSGISLTTLGSVAYSDYSDTAYVSKGKIEEDVRSMLGSLSEKGFSVASGANAYAAVAAGLVFDVPTDNGDYNAFDEEIPFYAMVFHGLRPLYTQAINLEADKEEAIMRAAIGGLGLSFSLINDFDISYTETGAAKLYGMVYEDNRAFIAEALEDYQKFYAATRNAVIDSYELISEQLSKTSFENGVVLYANHSGNPVESPLGIIEAHGWLWQ